MAICTDPAVTYLKGVGYNVVRLPSTKIQPMDVIGRDRGSPEWLGPIRTLCTSSKRVPRAKKADASSIQVTGTDAFRLGAGLKILRGLLASFNVDGAALGAAYSEARYLQFSFDHPVIRSVDPGPLGEWLLEAVPNTKNPFVQRYFGNPKCTTCVISEVLTSKSFSVAASDKQHRSVEVKLPSIERALKGEFTAHQVKGSAGKLRYAGKESLTFGFKAFALEHSFGIWVIKGIRPGEAVAGPGDQRDDPTPHIFDDAWLALRHLSS